MVSRYDVYINLPTTGVQLAVERWQDFAQVAGVFEADAASIGERIKR